MRTYIIAITLFLMAMLIGQAAAGYIPPTPTGLTNSTGEYWVNHTWTTGSGGEEIPYLLSGELDGVFNGYNWTGSTWQADTAIKSGLGGVGVNSAPEVFYMDSTWYLISGENDGVFNGYNWTGSTWQADASIISGLGSVGTCSTPEVFYMDSTWYLISGENDGVFNGYNWTGSTWQADTAIVGGLAGVGERSNPAVFYMGSTWYLISGELYGTFDCYNWTGSTWQADASIESGLVDVGLLSAPEAFVMDSTQHLIVGEMDGVFNGYNWTGSTWQADTAIVGGLVDVGARSAPAVFFMSTPANTTDSYNVSVNDVWHNTTTNSYYKSTYDPEDWQNITVYAYNTSGTGTPSTGSVSQNTQAPPTPPELQPNTCIRLDPHPDHVSFYVNSTYITCNFTTRESANVTIKFEKYNMTDNSSDVITDFGEFAPDQTAEFNIATSDYTTTGWYRAAMYDINGDILCYYEVAVRDNTSTNYEALHGTVRFDDADGIPSVSFVENIAGRGSVWTTDSISTTHSIVLWEYDTTWSMATGGNYEYIDHVNTSADVTNWVLSQTYDVNRYYRMILYSHDGEVLDTHCVKAVIPTSNVIEVRAEDVQTGVQIPIFVATIGSETKNSTDGVAYFYNVTNGAHVITVTASNYQDAQKTVYMANSYTNTTVYMLSYSPYAPPHHDVEFILISIVGTRYTDVNVSVSYMAENGEEAMMSGATDSAGSVTFSMVATIRYTITFESEPRNINKTIAIYPRNSRYYITVSPGGWDGLDTDHSPAKEIHTDAVTSVINDTHAYINVTYTDALNDTSSVYVYVNQSDPNDPRTPIMIDSDSGTSADETFVFIVTGYKGEDYKIHIVAVHGEFGTVERYHGVHMPGMLVDLNFPPFAYLLMSFVIILFVAGMFSQTNPETGSLICCVLGWIFLAFGWLASLGVFAALSLTLASVYAVATNISARHRKGGYI